jgi:tetratricopeptide (TPR) repeat protein
MKRLADLPLFLLAAGGAGCRRRTFGVTVALLPILAAGMGFAAAPAAAAPTSVSAAAPAPAATAPPAAGSAPSGRREGDFDFLLANLLATEGGASEALAAFEKAEKVNPDSAYIHLEHSQLLARMAQASRLPAAQTGYLRKAAAEVDKARAIAPENLDVLRGVGLIYVDLASVDPAALPTALSALQAVYESDPDDIQTAIDLGRLYLDQQQPAKAAEVFRDLIHRSPQQRAAYALLVEALLRDDKAAEAESVLKQILDFEPGALEARLTLAELEGRRNDYRSVLATLAAAPDPGRTDVRLLRQLAWAYYLTGDVDRALAAVEPLLRGVQAPGSDPEEVQLLLLKGLALAAQGHNKEAGDLLGKLRGSRPGDTALATILAKVLERAGEPEEGAHVLADLDAELAKAGKQDEERQARIELAQLYYDIKQWDKVGETLQPLLHVAGNGAKDDAAREPAVLLAADALVQRKSYDEALKLLDLGQAPSPASPAASQASPAITAKRAEVLFRAGRDQDGGRQLQELAASPNALDVLAAAETYQRLDKYADSIPPLEHLLAGVDATQPTSPPPPTSPPAKNAAPPGAAPPGAMQAPAAQATTTKAALFLLGAALERTGKREQAIAEFRRLLGADPEYHAALNYLGYMFAERGENLEEARALIEKAVALEPDNGAYVDSLGWVYYRLGRLDDARAALERATRLETTDGTVQEHLGDVYGAMGQGDLAGAAYRRAIALESDDPTKAELVRHKLNSLGAAGRRPGGS